MAEDVSLDVSFLHHSVDQRGRLATRSDVEDKEVYYDIPRDVHEWKMYIIYEFVNAVLDAIAYCNRRVATKWRVAIRFQMSKCLLSLFFFSFWKKTMYIIYFVINRQLLVNFFHVCVYMCVENLSKKSN